MIVNRIIIVFSSVLLVVLIWVNSSYTASYTVCDAGHGCNHTTIASAISALNNGSANTVIVKNPYSGNERVKINKAGASNFDRVVIIADSGYIPVTKGFVVTSNYVTVQGFEMTSCDSNACAIISADYVSIINNNIHGSNGTGYSYEIGTDDTISFRNHALIQGNKIHAGSHSGYQLIDFRCNNCHIDNNEIYNCIDCDAIRFWGHDTTISNNYIHDITYGNGKYHSDHFQTFGDCGSAGCHTAYNIVIEKNLCISTGADLQPFNLSNDSQLRIHDIDIRNNVFVNFGTQGNVGIPNMRIYNNTFINVGTINKFALNILYGKGWDDTDLVIKNNIFMQTYKQPPFKGDSRTTHDYNYVTRKSGTNWFTVPDFAETHGLNGGDPMFVLYNGTLTCGTYNSTTHKCSNFDFSIQTTSPAKDRGTRLTGFLTDKDGITRPQSSSWDIGAYD